MPFDQNNLPEWNVEGVEPPQSLKDEGWQPSQKPPADYFNWFFNKTFKSLQSLFTNAQHREEKGQPNGYAALNAEGKVINADGSLAGGVTSVNNKTGAVNLSAADVGAETPTGAQEKADQAEQNAKEYTDQEIASAKAYTDQQLATHTADTTTGAHKAKNIAVEDANNHFTGTDVESVLNELFTFANDGKTGVAAVIGSPATTGDTFSQLVTHIQNAKNTMTTNLSNKGVSANGTEALQALADKIANVNTGKKWASGNATSDINDIVTVTGLSFTPSIVYVKFFVNQRRYEAFMVSRNIAQAWGSSVSYPKYLLGAISYITTVDGIIYHEYAIGWNNDNDMLNGGFKMDIQYAQVDVTWEAWE